MTDTFSTWLAMIGWTGIRRGVVFGLDDAAFASPLPNLSADTAPPASPAPAGGAADDWAPLAVRAAGHLPARAPSIWHSGTELDASPDGPPDFSEHSGAAVAENGHAARELAATLQFFADAIDATHPTGLDRFAGFSFDPPAAPGAPGIDAASGDWVADAPPSAVTGHGLYELFSSTTYGSGDIASPTGTASTDAADAVGTFLMCGCPACVAARSHGQDAKHFQTGDLSPAAAGTGGAAPAAPAAPAYAIDALVNEFDYKWGSGALGSPVTVTYSFLTGIPNYYASNAAERVNFAPMNATQMAVVRDVLADYSHVANITFVEVSGVGSITFGTANLGQGIAGWAYYPYPGYSGPSDNYLTGDVWITNLYASYANPIPGTWEYQSFIHEIGHAIGMKHPGNYNAGGGGTPGPYLPAAEDSHQYTVMSYYSGPTYNGFEPITPQLYDVATIQYLYGANTSYHAGNDIYTFATSTQVETIWDGGGNDTIDAANQPKAVAIDLHPGSFSSIGSANGISAVNNIAIAYGTIIETAVGSSFSDTLKASDFGSTLNGGAGADQLVGGAGSDILIGGAGADIMTGGDGNDTFIIAANAGADTITDFIAGSASLDLVDLTAIVGVYNLAQVIAISSQNGAATLVNFGDGNTLTLQNVAEANLVSSDFLFAPPPNHAPIDISLTNSTVAEGSPNGTPIGDFSASDSDAGDTEVFSLVDNPGGKFSLNGTTLLVAGGLHGASYNIVVRVTDSAANTLDKAISIAISHSAGTTVTGTAGDDVIDFDHTPAAQPYATDQSDTIYGGTGDDYINGGGGADTLRGEAGNDVYIVDNPTDKVIELAGDGTDEIQSYNAVQMLGAYVENLTGLFAAGQRLGGNGLDNIIMGYTGNDTITGGDGNDMIDAGGGADRIYGDAGGDTITGGDGNDIAYGGDGNDTMYAGIGDDTLSGDNGNDTIYGGDGIDRLYGGGGNDFIQGDAGNDLLYGESGDDAIYGALGDDCASGGDGSDTIYGGDGIDRLHGDGGDDILHGDAGADLLYGDAGNDTLDGGASGDNMRGGTGDDIYVLDSSGDSVTELAGEGVDEIQSYNAVQMLGANVENLTGLSAAGQRLGGNALDNVMAGNTGNDVITADAGNDTVNAGGGDDRVYGEAGNDMIDGGTGNDIVYGGDGNDSLYGGSGDDTYSGGNGDDLLQGGDGIDRLYGDAGNDVIIGDAGNDIMYGSDGNDVLRGGIGADAMSGGTGDDVFVFAAADFQAGVQDKVADFHFVTGTDLDTLQLEGVAADYAFVDHASYVTVSDVATGGSIYLPGVTLAMLTGHVIYGPIV